MNPERWRQIEELYRAVRERGREALASADPEIRREVEELLAGDGTTLTDMGQAPVPIQVGQYRIEDRLGEGGMGVVYRARDTKLNRPVAIKFLSDELADATARRRFQREAQMASSLNHPHIVTVYDVGEIDGRQYIVTEYIDGGTLKQWARAEKRTWRDVVELLTGVADGLATAHAATILHRDIKPDNVLITRSGYAKLADFGLAKLEEEPVASEATSTLTANRTRPGVVIGTIAYMSPEQASGLKLDARSDIFSFGVVLFELLAGRRPFKGATDLETLQKVIHAAPEPLGGDTPAGLRTAVDKALAKDPAQRYQAMPELVTDLRRLARQSEETLAKETRRPARPFKWTRAATLIALLPVLLAAGFFAWRAWRSPESAKPLRAVPLNTLAGVQGYPSFSPDGNYVTFTWTGPKQDNPDIYVQQIGAGAPSRRTTDPGNDYNPVWSPDGRWIAFLRSEVETGASEVRLIPPLGGQERKLTQIRVRNGTWVTPPYMAWCPESNCLVVTDSAGEGKPDALFVISIETGDKRPLTNPQPPAIADTNPAVSPDGRWLVFQRANSLFNGGLYVLALGKGPLAAGEPRRLAGAPLNVGYPTWTPNSEEILFSDKAALWRMGILGDHAPTRLPFVGEDGVMPVVSRPQPGREPRLVYVRSFQDYNIWRAGTSAPGAPASSPPAVSISSTRGEWMPQLSPDGRRVAFSSNRSGTGEIWLADPDGSNAIQLTSTGAMIATGYPHWSPDGQLIVFHSDFEGQGEIYAIPAAGGKPRNLAPHPAANAFPSFSRDGKWIYFSSNRSGAYQVWKTPASGGEAVQVPNAAGYAPLESPDGAFLYFVEAMDKPSTLWRIPVSGGVPVKVLEGVVLADFAVLEKGIYYIDQPAGQGGVHYLDRPTNETRLRYFDFATRRSVTVAGNLGTVDQGLAVSPDGRTIFYSRMDSSVDDLMLVENFR